MYPTDTDRECDRHSATDTRRSSVALAPDWSGPPRESRSHCEVAAPIRLNASHTSGVNMWVVAGSAPAYLAALTACRASAAFSRNGAAAASAALVSAKGAVTDASPHTTTPDALCL